MRTANLASLRPLPSEALFGTGRVSSLFVLQPIGREWAGTAVVAGGCPMSATVGRAWAEGKRALSRGVK